MVGINTYTPLANNRLAGNASSALNPSPSTATVDQAQAGLATIGSADSVSAVARQLSQAATRAEGREANPSRAALAGKASEHLARITGNGYFASKARHDDEIPSTPDPQLLARARQATDFTHGAAGNPFKGMSRDQLALITYDDSGAFTVNEQRAAWEESYNQEQAWRQRVVAKAMDEFNRTGQLTEFFTEALEHYRGLPAIEQAQYPEDYASKLQALIDLDVNYKTHPAEGMGLSSKRLIEPWLSAGPHKER